MPLKFALEWIGQQLGAAGPARPERAAAAAARCGELWPLIAAASVLGEGIDARVLAGMLGMDRRQLVGPLAAARAAGLLSESFDGYNQGLCFADPELRQLAYDWLPPPARSRLHRAAAAALDDGGRAPPMAVVVRIASHVTAAGDALEASRWWRIAGELALQEATVTESIECLERARAVCRDAGVTMPLHDELMVLRHLGPLLAQHKGSGSIAVAEVYSRSLEITEQMDQAEAAARFDVLWGLGACILVHGRIETARELVGRLVRTSGQAGNRTQVMLARRLEGLAALLGGAPAAAIEAFDNTLAIYDEAEHAVLRFHYASDQAAVALAHKAWAEAIAGTLAASERSSAAALKHAERLRHPHTSAHVACVLAARAMTLQQPSRMAPLATAGASLARRHSYPYWAAWAEMLLGWHEGKRQPQAGTARLERAIAAYEATGATQALPMAQLLLASVAVAAGERKKAIAAAEDGLRLSAAHGVVMFDAELIRIRALALGRAGGSDALLERARVLADAQGAHLFAQRAREPLIRSFHAPNDAAVIAAPPI